VINYVQIHTAQYSTIRIQLGIPTLPPVTHPSKIASFLFSQRESYVNLTQSKRANELHSCELFGLRCMPRRLMWVGRQDNSDSDSNGSLEMAEFREEGRLEYEENRQLTLPNAKAERDRTA
jgi:hypothetical protein